MSSVDWNSIAIGGFMTAVTHPFTYAKVLVQLGHEPLSPVLRRNMYFRKQLQYPNVFQYLKHIQQTDGSFGLYRGLFPRIWANATTSITYTLVSKAMASKEKTIEDEKPTMDFSTVCKKTSTEMSARCAAVIVSQPFHVIAIRSMAQFIGRETIYTTMTGSIVEIYRDEGILGFFSGIVPRLLSEIISLWMCNVLTYAFNTYVLNESSELKELRDYTHMIMGYFAQTVTYPLSVTSTVMVVNGSKLKAGRLPLVPCYDNWVVCLKDLMKTGNANRGSSMFFRRVLAHANAASSVLPTPSPALS